METTKRRNGVVFQLGLNDTEKARIKEIAKKQERSMTAQVTVWLRERLEQETAMKKT